MVLVTVQKTLLVPRVQCIDFPVVLQRQIPMTFCLSPEEYKVRILMGAYFWKSRRTPCVACDSGNMFIRQSWRPSDIS